MPLTWGCVGVRQPTAELLLSLAQDITDLGKISRDLSSPASISIIAPGQSTILKETKHSTDREGVGACKWDSEAFAQGDTPTLSTSTRLVRTLHYPLRTSCFTFEDRFKIWCVVGWLCGWISKESSPFADGHCSCLIMLRAQSLWSQNPHTSQLPRKYHSETQSLSSGCRDAQLGSQHCTGSGQRASEWAKIHKL